MLASTYMDLVVGLDVHFEMVPMPAPTPTPFPHPFMGMVGDLKALAVNLIVSNVVEMAMAGELKPPKGPVLINLIPATNTGTDVKNKTVLPHFVIPPGTMWTPMPKAPKPKIGLHESPPPDPPVAPAGDAVLMMGSKTVTIMGSNAVRFGDLAMSCSEPLRMPSSTVMAIPKGMPVMIGGPPAIDWVQAAGALLRSKWVANHLHGLVSRIKNVRLQNLLTHAVCFLTGHPIDVASGRLLTWQQDFALPGPIPLKFERSYASGWAGRDGTLGHGWSHTLDEAVWLERGRVVYRSGDGREVEFDTFNLPGHMMRQGDEIWEPISRLSLRCLGPLRWEIESAASGLIREFEQQPAEDRTVTSRLTRIRNRAGHDIRLAYDSRARLSLVRDSGGRELLFEHDDAGRLSRIALPHPTREGSEVHTQYQYSSDGDLVAVMDPMGHTARYEYAGHLLVKETDRNGLSFFFGYDGVGAGARCVRTWGDGGIYDHELSYDTQNHVTCVTNSLGHTTTYYANAVGAVVRIVDPLGNEKTLEYDDNLRVVARGDANGRTEYTYDQRGNCLSVKTGSGVARFEYDRNDKRITRVDRCGRKRSFQYDERGLLTRVEEANGEVTRYEYQRGLLSAQVMPNGSRTELLFDPAGNMVGLTSPSGGRVSWEYDRLGRQVAHVSAKGARATTGYDRHGRALSYQDHAGAAWTFERDPEGNLIRRTGIDSQVTYGYWGKGRVAWRETGGLRSSYQFDTEGFVVGHLNDAGELTRFEYDAAGKLVAETGPDRGRRRYERNAGGRVVAIEKASGTKLALGYDAGGRLSSIQHPDGEETYVYDPEGALIAAENAHAKVAFTRDERGRVTREESEGPAGKHSVASDWERGGRRRSWRTSRGCTMVLAHDTIGRERVLAARCGTASVEVRSEHDVTGAEQVRHLGGGVAVNWTRDPAGRTLERVVRRGGAALEAEHYKWSGPCRLEMTINSERGACRLRHDPRGYLVDATGVGPSSQVRQVDAAGNIFRSPSRDDRVYGAGGKLLRDGETSYEYDADGNLTRRKTPVGDWTFRYNALGLLQMVVRPDGQQVTFGYDALRRRVSKSSAGGETRWEWDGHRPIHEVPPSGETITWLWDDGRRCALGRLDEQGVELAVHDINGGAAALVDAKGALVWSGTMGLYGQPAPDAPDRWPWRWAGQYHDAETGLHYNRFRYYDPASGRYTTPDPLGLLGGPNRYGYCRDPILGRDPLGLSECGPFENQMPQSLEDELAQAERLGVTPMRPGDPGFEELVNSGRVKWAVNEQGELLFIPHTVDGEEIAHSVLTGGQPVMAAGEAEIVAAGETMIATDVNRHSGHFQPSEGSLDTGVTAMQSHGIDVHPSVVDPTLPP